jgi:phosphatidylglycerophosphate synthase
MYLTVATQITLLRVFLVPFFIVTILYYSPEKDHLRFWALGIFGFAVLTDLLDGY